MTRDCGIIPRTKGGHGIENRKGTCHHFMFLMRLKPSCFVIKTGSDNSEKTAAEKERVGIWGGLKSGQQEAL